ncbi:MAG: SLC13 family permease [Candidatus Binatia bacterium]|nr:SLC13 family permease [Candidatus Binatia bacterium]
MPANSGLQKRDRHTTVGRVLGPLVFAVMLGADPFQDVMPTMAWRTAAVGLWMAIWWATEAVPVAVTAFLPLIVFEPLGVASFREAAAPFADPIVYLFLGGFLLALAVERWNLHRRVALAILERIGTDGRRLIGGFMLACALLSMWMTNTSTTMMLLPIVLSVIAVVRDGASGVGEEDRENFAVAMLLGIAYAASIGGLATLIGTPPNAFLVGYLADTYGYEISFARWMMIGIPVSALMLPFAWWLLTSILFPVRIGENRAIEAHLHALRDEMGAVTTQEKRVGLVFLSVIACWILRRPLSSGLGWMGLSDAGIAMTGAVALFLLPSGDRAQPQLLVWKDAARLPWGVLILFGGGLSLAKTVSKTGLALWLGESLSPLGAWGPLVLVIAAVTLMVFLTELTSNLATAATLLPVLGAIAVQSSVSPILLAVPVTIAASCAFMLPVATPPNAIVFSTGNVRIPQMVRAGFWLNLIGIAIVTAICHIIAPALLGGDVG